MGRPSGRRPGPRSSRVRWSGCAEPWGATRSTGARRLPAHAARQSDLDVAVFEELLAPRSPARRPGRAGPRARRLRRRPRPLARPAVPRPRRLAAGTGRGAPARVAARGGRRGAARRRRVDRAGPRSRSRWPSSSCTSRPTASAAGSCWPWPSTPAGRQAEALDAVARAKRVLRDDLGPRPGRRPRRRSSGPSSGHDPTLPQGRAPRSSHVCPYQGLTAFQPEHQDLFVGRETDVVACLRRLDEHPLLLVVGSSGSGKSSLVRAGIVPALRRRWSRGRGRRAGGDLDRPS